MLPHSLREAKEHCERNRHKEIVPTKVERHRLLIVDFHNKVTEDLNQQLEADKSSEEDVPLVESNVAAVLRHHWQTALLIFPAWITDAISKERNRDQYKYSHPKEGDSILNRTK